MRKLSVFLLPALALVLLSACTFFGGGNGTGERDTLYLTATRDGGGSTGITGRIITPDGTPVSGAYVNVYPDSLSNLLGPSQYISSPTDATGHYTIEAPPGDYFIVARKRISGEPFGSLSPGDLYSEHQRVRTTVVARQLSIVDLTMTQMLAPMFFKKAATEQVTTTGIRGVLVDAAGKPVPVSFAVAYDSSDIQRLPDYASTLSDGDGRFTLYLPKGGTYYLAARVNAWDMPRTGELYGKFGGDTPTPVMVDDDQFVEDVRIVLTPFTGVYKEGKSRRPATTPQ